MPVPVGKAIELFAGNGNGVKAIVGGLAGERCIDPDLINGFFLLAVAVVHTHRAHGIAFLAEQFNDAAFAGQVGGAHAHKQRHFLNDSIYRVGLYLISFVEELLLECIGKNGKAFQ